MIENIRLSFQGIWSHKMRSFLTMLGIIIGIASIIAIVSTIKGTSEQIKEDLIGAGNNTVSITLYDGDNLYDTEMGMSGGTPPIISRFITAARIRRAYIIRIQHSREERYTGLI